MNPEPNTPPKPTPAVQSLLERSYNQWAAQRFDSEPEPAGTADLIGREMNRRLEEHLQLLAMVSRLAFLLNSTRLVLTSRVANDIAGNAVREAEELLAKVRA